VIAPAVAGRAEAGSIGLACRMPPRSAPAATGAGFIRTPCRWWLF